MTHRRRVVILASHPIQYQVPIYRELSERNVVELVVLFRTRVGLDAYHDRGFGRIVQWDIPLLGGYRHEFLSRKTRLNGLEWSLFHWILRLRPQVLMIYGYGNASNILALLFGKLLGIKILIRGDARLSAIHGRGNVIRTRFKRALFRLVDGFVSIGSENRDFYLANGVPANKIFFAPFCVDNARFYLSEERRSAARSKVRAELNIPDNACVVLFASKLVPLKRADDVLFAMAQLWTSYPSLYLLIVGAGATEGHLRELVLANANSRVLFAGFRNQSELPDYYAASDIFVFPSENDTWGLVLNETMAAGLPCVVSDGVGAAPDLVEGKGTGIVYPCGNVDRLAQALGHFVGQPALRVTSGRNARALIENWGVASCADGMIAAIEEVAGSLVK